MDIDANVVIDKLTLKLAQQTKEIAILQTQLETMKKGKETKTKEK